MIELNLKMLILTRFVTKNHFFHVRINGTDVNIFKNGENNIGHVVLVEILIV